MRSPIFDIEHLQLFSPLTAADLLHRAGFENIEVHGIVNAYPLHYYLKLMPLPQAIELRLMRAAQRGWLGRTSIPAALGILCVVGFRSAGEASSTSSAPHE
jgi:hypothetical protein